LSGGDGDDTINGGTDDDTLEGGLGDDILNGDSGDDLITTSLGADTIDGGEGDDTFVIQGENGNGESAPTSISGGSGFNFFQFMAGTFGDLVLNSTDGGVDTLDFSLFDHGITINMGSTERQEVATWEETSLVEQEQPVIRTLWITLSGFFTNLIGTNQADSLLGNDIANTIEGRDGDDAIGGAGGVDNLYGGDQTDLANSIDLTDGEDTDLDASASTSGVAHEDNWFSIEMPVKLPKGDEELLFGTGGGTLIIPVTGVEPIMLECTDPFQTFVLVLPSGDHVQISGLCELMDGRTFWATFVSETAETMPATVDPLKFNSGVTLNLWEGVDAGSLQPLTNAPGNLSFDYSLLVKPDFKASPLQPMYWDTFVTGGGWAQLPDYAEENGLPKASKLHTDVEDGMWITSGGRVVNNYLNVATNFFGTLMAVQP
jgi:hypothetical protein